jgi:hypothetical protein
VPGTYRSGKAGNPAICDVSYATKGDYLLSTVPNFNVTGQSESSVSRNIKTVDQITSGFAG